MKKKFLFIFLLLLFIFFGGWFRGRSRSSRVEEFFVVKGDLAITTSVSGRIKANRELALAFPIAGRLMQEASAGAVVREGEVVAALETADLYAAYLMALSNLNKARSLLANAVEAKAGVEATYAGRESENAVKAKLAESRTLVEANNAAVDSAKFSVDQALASLSKGTLRAPFSGTIVRVSSQSGEVLPAGTPVATLADLSSFYFQAEVDEVDVVLLKVGQTAQVSLDAFPGKLLSGVVERIEGISHTTDSGGTAYDVRLRMEVTNDWELRSGFNGEASIVRQLKSGVFSLPSQFIYQKDGQSFVRLKQGERFKEQPIELGDLSEGWYEVLQGLTGGETVVRFLDQ